jgi:hypothetical protein
MSHILNMETEEQDLLDLPDPLRPIRAYRCPAFRRNLALERISTPSPFAFAFPFLSAVFSPDVMVMLRPSMSSCRASANALQKGS